MDALEKTFQSLKNTDRVKVIFPSGIYLQGRKKKVLRDIQQFRSDLKILKTEISYIPVPFRINLCKEIVIYIN